MKTILITGGAGFIGSHLCVELLNNGYEVIVYDNLDAQAHGYTDSPPASLPREVTFIYGDVRDEYLLTNAVSIADAVVHLAAKEGAGESMCQIAHYTDVNNRGTALLLEVLCRTTPKKLIVASSMSIYGEGYYLYKNKKMEVPLRSAEQLKKGIWDIHANGAELQPLATSETKTPAFTSVYALSKYDQEKICLMIGEAYDFPVTALRFFNVYGEHQNLSNRHTGVLARFASNMLSGKATTIFEDGLQQRDFVHVRDVAVACRLALESDEANGQVINIGSGTSHNILDVAQHLSTILQKGQPHVTGKYRPGDVRHCFADISKARSLLGYEPQITLVQGLATFTDWLMEQASFGKKSRTKTLFSHAYSTAQS